jgi:hypothetical protein
MNKIITIILAGLFISLLREILRNRTDHDQSMPLPVL